MNKVILSGNIGKDPELKQTQTVAICSFSLATTEKVKKGDIWEDKTEWHSIKCFGHNANYARKYFNKGSKILIEGKIQTTSWDDDNGVKKYKTEIIAERFENLTSKSEPNTINDEITDNAVDDLPF